MTRISAAVIFSALAANMSAASAENSGHAYTETKACKSIDLQDDEFVVLCKGPGGLAASLHYFDGSAIASFGKAGGEADRIEGEPLNHDEPIRIGGADEVFGPKIEWTLRNDIPCAATVRVNTDKGSRLVVTSLSKGVGRVGMEKTSDSARAKAEKACDGFSTAETTTPTETAGPATMKLAYEQRGPEDAAVKAMWGDILDEAQMPGGGPVWAYVAEVGLEDGRKLVVSQIYDMIGCGSSTCPMSVMVDGKITVQSALVCDATEHHLITARGDAVIACDTKVPTGIR